MRTSSLAHSKGVPLEYGSLAELPTWNGEASIAFPGREAGDCKTPSWRPESH